MKRNYEPKAGVENALVVLKLPLARSTFESTY